VVFQRLQLLSPSLPNLDHFNLEMQTLPGQGVIQVGYHHIVAH
jgi:hypothetical protein